jgi:hypothetical protein
MPRWFNIAGPCFAQEHYMLPPERRLGDAMELIEQGRWFALVSGRQTGKTTAAMHMVQSLQASKRYVALRIDLESACETPDVAETMLAILDSVERVLERPSSPIAPLGAAEVQRLVATPRSALTPAPHSVVLAGVRSVRDYVMARDERNKVSWLGHCVCNPTSGLVECIAIPAIDFCNNDNCQTRDCTTSPCVPALRRQTETGATMRVNNTTTPATWFGAQLYRQTSTLEAIHWFTGGEPGTCLGRCLGEPCALDSDCGAGFACVGGTCIVRQNCLGSTSAVSCWNSQTQNNEAIGGCR